MPEDTRTMVASPIAALLKSRKFILLITAVFVDLMIAFVPAFESMKEQLITVVSALFGALILGISHEDASEKSAPTSITTGSAESVNVNTQPPADTPPTVGRAMTEAEIRDYGRPHR